MFGLKCILAIERLMREVEDTKGILMTVETLNHFMNISQGSMNEHILGKILRSKGLFA